MFTEGDDQETRIAIPSSPSSLLRALGLVGRGLMSSFASLACLAGMLTDEWVSGTPNQCMGRGSLPPGPLGPSLPQPAAQHAASLGLKLEGGPGFWKLSIPSPPLPCPASALGVSLSSYFPFGSRVQRTARAGALGKQKPAGSFLRASSGLQALPTAPCSVRPGSVGSSVRLGKHQLQWEGRPVRGRGWGEGAACPS